MILVVQLTSKGPRINVTQTYQCLRSNLQVGKPSHRNSAQSMHAGVQWGTVQKRYLTCASVFTVKVHVHTPSSSRLEPTLISSRREPQHQLLGRKQVERTRKSGKWVCTRNSFSLGQPLVQWFSAPTGRWKLWRAFKRQCLPQSD